VNEQPETVIRNEEGDPVPQFVINPANYRRYTPYVELLEAVDTKRLVESYRSHYSLFQEAYRQMGYADGEFNDRLDTTIDELLATPDVSDPVKLRMGSANAARVKLKLAEIRKTL